MNISQRLQSLMDERGYTMYKLAKEMHCAQSSIKNWLEKGVVPQKVYLSQLSEIFDVSIEYLKGETDDRGSAKKETPTPKSEREEEIEPWLMDLARKSVLMEMFQKLTMEEQYDVILQILARKQAEKDLRDLR